ncbi:MAG: ABC transporter ATP-binding protein [Bacteroidales bacterium]
MIQIKELTKAYGEQVVLNINDLTISKGESFGLVGNNGAGKTTMFRCVLDLIRPSSGSVFSKGEDVAKKESWKKYTGSYLDDGFLIDFLTPEEYFRFVADVYGLSDGDLQQFYLDFEEFFNNEILGKKKLIRDLSSGNRQKIGIASALMPKPEVLVLDEPFNSLDPSTQIRLKNLLNKLKLMNSITMLISSHDLNHITEVCDRIVILHEGIVVHDLQRTEDTLRILEDYFSVKKVNG